MPGATCQRLPSEYCWFFHQGRSRDCLKVAARKSDDILAALFDKFDVPVIGQALLEGITISSPRDIT